MQIAAIKGGVAGVISITAALLLGANLPAPSQMAVADVIGLVGYGISLVLFVVALRHLGTARTGAYFSTAPFVGACLAVGLFGEHPQAAFWIAAALMALGVWLHVSERHLHEHVHEALEHAHRHRHDEHYTHSHDFPWDGVEPRSHRHAHEHRVHSHPHYPDLHHRHRH